MVHILLGPDRAAGAVIQRGFIYQGFISLSLFPHLCSQREGNPGLSAVFISNTPPYIRVNHVVLKIISKPQKTTDSGIVTNPAHGGICLKVHPVLMVVMMIALFAVKQDHRIQD